MKPQFLGLGCGLTSLAFPGKGGTHPLHLLPMPWEEWASLSCCPQDCLRACQEQIEAALRESLREASQPTPTPELKTPRGSSSQGPSQTSTPTEVTAIHL